MSACNEKINLAKTEDESNLEWITFRQELLADAPYFDSPGEKLRRKVRENPMVPIGAMSTIGALSYGLWCFRKGFSKASQTMMRARLVAQGFTVVAILTGAFVGGNLKNSSRKADNDVKDH